MDVTHRHLVAVVAVLAGLTVVAMVVLWPSPDRLPEVEDREALTPAVVRSVTEYECPEDGFFAVEGPCLLLRVEVLDGPDAGRTVEIDTTAEGYPPFAVGDRVKLVQTEMPDGTFAYFVQDFHRLPALTWLFALFVGAVLATGRWHGLRSLVGLALSLLIITRFVVPGIVAGTNPFVIATVGAFGVMLVTLYLAHGLNEKTTAAIVGTAAALLLTVLLGGIFVTVGKITGFTAEGAQLVRWQVEGLDLRGLVLAGLIIGALGVLDDVTVSQASTVFAVHAARPDQTWAELFVRAMSVGRDHIASVVNTLVLAYAGASLPLLVLFSTGGLPTSEVLNAEVVAQEIVRTLVGSIGLISAVPLTTALAAAVAVRLGTPEGAGGGGEGRTRRATPGRTRRFSRGRRAS